MDQLKEFHDEPEGCGAAFRRMTVFFIPGTLISPEVFERVRLPEGVCAVNVSWMDAPGSHDVREVGRKVARMIEDGNYGPVILAGHSSGGSIAMLAYLALGERSAVKGMILSNTGPNNHGHSNQKSREELIASWNRRELELFIRKCFVKQPEPEMFDRLMKYGEKISAETRVEPLMSQREIDLTDRLWEIRCPTVIAHGKLDTIRTLDHAGQLADGIPGSRLALLDGGHSPMYEDPEGYSRVLEDLVKMTEDHK